MNSHACAWNVMFVVALVFSSMTSCAKSSIEEFQPAYWPTQEWKNSPPEEQGMESAQLVRMFEYIEANDIPLHSLLIVRNGYLVTEAYWHPYGWNNTHSIESVTKSIIGTLIGIAIEQRAIRNVEQKLLDFFPQQTIQNLDGRKKSIALHDLLSMTPGLDCEDAQSLDRVTRSDDWVQSLLDLPMTSKPGSEWIYCSGASHLLSAVLQEATGIDARSYANQHLFATLGIPQVTEKDWSSDPQEITNGIAGLYLTPRDMAKFGFLYLNSGNWNGQQVVPADWVKESTREQAYIGEDEYMNGLDRRFGYLWSIFPDQNYYGYLGRGGQELIVIPQENIVIVFTGALKVDREGALLNLINDYIVPSVRSENSIPSNPEAHEKLELLIRLAAGTIQSVPVLPDIALNISNKKYKLEPNFLGWSDMTFFFEQGLDEATLKMTNSPALKIGLDHRYRLTEVPNGRPIGLRGQWIEKDLFYLDYIVLGDFIRSEARITFEGDKIMVTITYLNWNSPPIVLRGKVQG